MSQTYIPIELRRKVAEQASNRCGYCLTPSSISGARMQFDHIHPEADGGPTSEENLWLACSGCNSYKTDRVMGVDPETKDLIRLFNPRRQLWSEHFRWNEEGD